MDYFGTIGPSCDNIDTLEKLFQAGMTGIRINLSHINLPQCGHYIDNIKAAASKLGINAKILIDIQGPELRIGDLDKPLNLTEGEYVHLGDYGIPVPKILLESLNTGDTVLIDDSSILLKVADKSKNSVKCSIIRGGTLTSRKSIAAEGIEIDGPTLTEDDYMNIEKINQYGITGVMLPFVRSKEDLQNLKTALINAHAASTQIYAKIENQRGVNSLSSFIDLADEIIIARGDLGNSMPLYELPETQKKLAGICNKNKKSFMVVTQLLHSMINSAVPTRAEVSDIFNSVLDGASSLMLTGETAIGKYPVDAMKYLVKTAEEALKYKNTL